MQTFDLIVIGSGAGLIVAEEAAAQHMQVAVVESGPMGGTCLNRGCIPSKMLIRSADVMETARRAAEWGIELEVRGVNWQAIVGRVAEAVKADEVEVEQRVRDNPHITLIRENARFAGPKVLEAGDDRLTAERMVIAAGTRPTVPEVPGLQDVPYLTSDDALWLETQPRRLAIVGGGDIAAELAHFFGGLGTDVTIVNKNKLLLRREDADVAQRFTEVYERRFRVLSKTNLTAVRRAGDAIELDLRRGENETLQVTVDSLLFATGRTPNSDRVNALASGVRLDERGFVQADRYLETDAEGIWTLGDIAGRYMLRHSANLEAECVAHNILHPDDQRAVDYHAMPHAVFASPQVGAVGLTEDEAKQRQRRYAVGRADYYDTTYGRSIEDRDGFVKAITDADSHEILGCHVIGADAAILVQEAANAMRRHETAEAITSSIYIHPALQEVVKDAFVSIATHGEPSA